MSSLHVILAASRFIYDAAMMFVFGVNTFVCAVAPRDLGRAIALQLRTPVFVAVLAAAAATAIWFPLQAALIGGKWTEAFDTSLMTTLLDDTLLGHVWAVRVLLALLLLMVTAALRPPPSLLLSLSALALASLAFSGHAMMDEWPRAAIHIVNHAVHVLAAAAWIGSIVPVLLCLTAVRDAPSRTFAAVALRRFSVLGHTAVALAIGTGIVDMLLVLGHLPVHWSSPYQLLLAIKIALVAVMVVLALGNRYVLLRQVELDDGAAIKTMRRHTLTELTLAACVLALVAVFGMLDPMS